MSRRARLAVYSFATLSIILLLLGSQAYWQACRLNQPLEVRCLEAPGAEFLWQVCPESHLEVVQLSPLRLAGTVLCQEDFRQSLQHHLQSLYQIQPDQGEELVLIAGRVPFHWVDHPNLAAAVLAVGLLLLGPAVGLSLQHLLTLRKKPRLYQVPTCSHQRKRGQGWRKLALFGTLATVSGLASPLLLLALILGLTAWALARLLFQSLRRLAQRLNPRARQTAAPTPRPIENGLQEAAIILMSFPPEFSASIFKHLSPDQVQRITLEISKLPPTSPELRQEIFQTFHSHLDKVCRGHCPGQRGGDCDAAATSRLLIELYLNTPIQAPLRSSRSRRRIFACPTCDEVFIDEGSLRRHQSAAHPTLWVGRLRRVRRWLTIALLSSSLGAALGLVWALESRPLTASDLLQQQLQRYLASPISVAMVERQGERSALVGLEAGSISPEVRQLLKNSALQVGLQPEKIECIEAPYFDTYANQRLGLWLLLPSLTLLAWMGLRLRRRLHSPLPDSNPSPQPTSTTSPLPASNPSPHSPLRTSPQPSTPAHPAVTLDPKPTSIGPVYPDPVSVSVGRSLLDLVNPAKGAPMLERIPKIRRHLASELGLILPGVRFRDDLRLAPDTYTINLHGRVIAKGKLHPGHYLSIGPESNLKGLSQDLSQDLTHDPTFGQPALWIKSEQRGDSERLGCVLFDPISVFAMHFTELARQHAWELLRYDQACTMLKQPHLRPVLRQLKARQVDKVLIWEVLQLLLKERISIADLETILECILRVCSHTRQAEDLREHVRVALRQSTLQRLCLEEHGDSAGKLLAFRLTEEMEATLRQPLEPKLAAQLLLQLEAMVEKLRDSSTKALLVTSPDCRPALRQLLDPTPHTVVLSTAEIPPEAQIEWLQPEPQPSS